LNHTDATDDLPLDPDATEVVEMDLEAMLHLELDLQKRSAPRTMPMMQAAARASSRFPLSSRSIPKMPIHNMLPPPSRERQREREEEADEAPTSFYNRDSVRSSVPSVKSVAFRAGEFSAPRSPRPFAIVPRSKKRDAGESMGITPIQPVLPPTSRRDLMAIATGKSAYESLAPMSMGSSYPSYPPPAPRKSIASTLSLILTLTFALASVGLMGVAVMKPAAIDRGKTTITSVFSKSKKAAPATSVAQKPIAAAQPAITPAMIAVPPVLFEEGVIEEVGETEAYLVFPDSARGHRLFIDGRVVGEGNDRGMLVECGKHKVQLGSSGTLRTLDLPCGGGWRLSE